MHRDDLEEGLTRVGHKRDSPVIAALGWVFLLEEHLDNHVLPHLRHPPLLPDPEADVVEGVQRGRAGLHAELQELGGEVVWPHGLGIGHSA